jgi:DNA polymerase (family X)
MSDTTKTQTAHRFSHRAIAEELEQIGAILQILEANQFRVNAYLNAAEAIRGLSQDINRLYADGKLESIAGVGKGIAALLDELFATGKVEEFEELKRQVPAGVVEMTRVPDVGPKTAKRLWQELDITSVAELRAAAEAGKIRALKGFGAKSEEKILKGIELASRRGDERTPLGHALPQAQEVVRLLRKTVGESALARIEIAGSLRRWKDTIGDVDILAVSKQAETVMEAFRTLPVVADVTGAGDKKSSVVLNSGLQVDLRVVEPKHWGAALQYFTGSKEHSVPLRERAQRMGWSLNEYGLTATGEGGAETGEEEFFAEEADLYGFFGMDWIPPELRENRGEHEAALNGKLPKLIQIEDIQGELHGHSAWSDGTAEIAEMAQAAQDRGYRYWALCDHSVGLGMVNGLDAERLAAQAEEIRKLNDQYARAGLDFRLLRGVEVEILADGKLGLPDEVLAELDVVVASIHSGQRQARETITQRCIAAIQNPHVDILGHPTGRLIGSRAPSDIDLEAVLAACAETKTVVEINAHPSRLDLNDVYARRAVELGCLIAINSDAHEATGMAVMPYGIGTARRAWLEAKDVVNTRPLDEMLKLLK